MGKAVLQISEEQYTRFLSLIRAAGDTDTPLIPGTPSERFAPLVFPPHRPFKSGEIKAVILDVYGTLFSSAAGEVGAAMGSDTGNLEHLARSCCGISGHELRDEFKKRVQREHERRYSETPYPEVRVQELWADFPPAGSGEAVLEFALLYELAVNPAKPMPHLVSVLETLRMSALPLGIVSNAQFFTPLLFQAFSGKNVSELGFQKDLIAWSCDYRLAKPCPDLFAPVLHALKMRGIKASEAVYVGNDMLNDVSAAQNCGMKTCLFAGDSLSLRERAGNPLCDTVLPDAVLMTLQDLPSLLELSKNADR